MMKNPDDLDRALRTWFDAEARWKAPPALLEAVATEVHSRRPRARLFATAWPHGAGAPPATVPLRAPGMLAFIALALLLVAIVAAALIGAGSPSPHLAVVPTAGPTLQPSMTVEEVTQVVIARFAIDGDMVALATVLPRITKVTLVAPGETYDFGAGFDEVDASALTWVVQAEGTHAICSSFCDVRDSGFFIVNDAAHEVEAWRGNPLAPAAVNIPSTAFRQLLADHGLQWMPATVPAAGVVSPATVVKSLDPRWFPATTAADPAPLRDGPMYGLITVVDAGLAQSAGPLAVTPVGGTRAVWWVGALSPPPGPDGGDFQWAAFDAETGEQLLTGPR